MPFGLPCCLILLLCQVQSLKEVQAALRAQLESEKERREELRQLLSQEAATARTAAAQNAATLNNEIQTRRALESAMREVRDGRADARSCGLGHVGCGTGH